MKPTTYPKPAAVLPAALAWAAAIAGCIAPTAASKKLPRGPASNSRSTCVTGAAAARKSARPAISTCSDPGKEVFQLPKYEHDGRVYEVDEDGFLQEPELWNETVACDFAACEDVPQMTDAHWVIVNYLRNYYLQFGIAPMRSEERRVGQECRSRWSPYH